MSFNTLELSNYDGKPIRFYEIMFGNRAWYYNQSDRDIIWNGTTYVGVNIGDDGIQQSADTASDALTLDAPADLPIVAEWRGTPPSDQVFLTIRDTHYGDPDGEAPVVWIGTITDVKRPTPATAKIVGQTLSMTFKRSGLRLTYSRNCPYFLYDVNCTVDPEQYKIAGVITALDGTTLTAPEWGGQSRSWAGGFIAWDRNGTLEKRTIELDLGGGRIQLMGFTDKIEVGMTVFAYPGCARVSSVCNDDFNNIINYGGFKALPGKSPFDGNPVF
jgi:uncharacterized phage protein (TIGR02218 family)